MKKIAVFLVTMVAVTALAASLALAEPCTSAKTAAGKAGCDKPCPSGAQMGECCLTSAVAGKGCCGKTAAEVKAAAASCPTVKAAKAEMHACCAEALDAGKGCCGKDAEGLKADFNKKVKSQEKKMASN